MEVSLEDFQPLLRYSQGRLATDVAITASYLTIAAPIIQKWAEELSVSLERNVMYVDIFFHIQSFSLRFIPRKVSSPHCYQITPKRQRAWGCAIPSPIRTQHFPKGRYKPVEGLPNVFRYAPPGETFVSNKPNWNDAPEEYKKGDIVAFTYRHRPVINGERLRADLVLPGIGRVEEVNLEQRRATISPVSERAKKILTAARLPRAERDFDKLIKLEFNQ